MSAQAKKVPGTTTTPMTDTEIDSLLEIIKEWKLLVESLEPTGQDDHYTYFRLRKVMAGPKTTSSKRSSLSRRFAQVLTEPDTHSAVPEGGSEAQEAPRETSP